MFGLQVLQDYAQYGDAMVGRYGIRPDGTPSPNVRTLVKPLLNLFHGERGCKRWKQAVDSELRTAVSVSGLLEVSRQPSLRPQGLIHRVSARSTSKLIFSYNHYHIAGGECRLLCSTFVLTGRQQSFWQAKCSFVTAGNPAAHS